MKVTVIRGALQAACLLLAMALVQGCVSTGDMSADKAQDAAQFNAQLGAQYLQRGELDQAREKLLKALEQDDNNALAHVTYAQLQARVLKPDSAQIHFKKALQLEPDEANHRNSYGIYLCEHKQY